jgi:hypothetical protein
MSNKNKFRPNQLVVNSQAFGGGCGETKTEAGTVMKLDTHVPDPYDDEVRVFLNKQAERYDNGSWCDIADLRVATPEEKKVWQAQK